MKHDTLTTLDGLSDAELMARVKSLALRERDATAQLVAHLAVLDTRDAVLREGYPSLFVYCRDALGLSESEAYNRIEVARAARQYPLILEMLSAGDLHLWSVRLLAPHLTPANHREVLELARGKRKTIQVQEIVARLAPRPDVPTTITRIPPPAPDPVQGWPVSPAAEAAVPGSQPPASEPGTTLTAPAPPPPPAIVMPLSPDRYKFQLTITGDMLDKLQCAKDMLSHAVSSGGDAAVLDRALTALLVELARRKFAVGRKPRRSRGRKDDADIPAAVKRVVYVRCRGRCTFIGAHGHRCDERRFVQFHHLDARALGGKAAPDRITLRCRRHNDYEGRLLFGKRRRTDGAGVAEGAGDQHAGTTNLLRNKLAPIDRGAATEGRLAVVCPPPRLNSAPV